MDSREVSIEFAQAFCAGDLVRLEAVLHPDLAFHGPLFVFDTREGYMQRLRAAPPEPAQCEVLRAHGSADEAAILYEYRKASAPVLVAQFTRLQEGLISEIRLVFDTADLL